VDKTRLGPITTALPNTPTFVIKAIQNGSLTVRLGAFTAMILTNDLDIGIMRGYLQKGRSICPDCGDVRCVAVIQWETASFTCKSICETAKLFVDFRF
jgi:hypothetical protein